jgi:DNA-directed RNA polymerases I, II, and III subunit RPABC3
MSSEIELVNARLTVDEVNDAKYDNVTRLLGKEAGSGALAYQLDVNTDIWPVTIGDSLTMCLASSINLDGSKDDGKGWRDANKGEATLADDYDYVCHGKVYRFEEGNGENM